MDADSSAFSICSCGLAPMSNQQITLLMPLYPSSLRRYSAIAYDSQTQRGAPREVLKSHLVAWQFPSSFDAHGGYGLADRTDPGSSSCKGR
jgi:hypothetical protein